MDPQLRMLLEVTHEAIFDAGVNPQEIRGQNVGVFIGAIASDSERKWIENTSTKHGYALTGIFLLLLVNFIAQFFKHTTQNECSNYFKKGATPYLILWTIS